MNRRSFLKQTGLAAGAAAVHNLHGAPQGIALIVDPKDPVASSAASSWAVRNLQDAFTAQGATANIYPRIDAAPAGSRHILIAGTENAAARQILSAAPSSPEALALATGQTGGRSVLLASGSDARGLVFAVLELADRLKYGSSLDVKSPIVEKPANTVRSCARCFVSDIEDKSWFYDRELWADYLTTLATHRFSRFNLTLGIGYNSNHNIPDAYFYFAYPFLLP
ncbi:MAG TPA: twin-arginine translocation signal domain-containing protein, partial [Bryobacteraceae bacterium]